jgi:voltage-gated potassium channel
VVVIAFGTLGFMLVESDWSPWKSLFFTLITITTVGYGDEGLSPNGEVFAAVLLLMGIGTATYSLTSLVQIAINYQNAWKRKMKKQIDQFEDHFIICGFGRIGHTVAQQLQEAGIPFVVIDCDQQVIEDAIDSGYLALQGNSTDDETLCQAGVERARGIVCAINSDAENVFVTLCVRELNPNAFVASRASTESAAQRMERAGATLVVSPYTTAGENIADAILRPKLAEFLRTHRNSEFELSEITISEESVLAGQLVREVGEKHPTIVFVALRRTDGQLAVRPGANETFLAGDTITVAGTRESLEQIYGEEEASVSPELATV